MLSFSVFSLKLILLGASFLLILPILEFLKEGYGVIVPPCSLVTTFFLFTLMGFLCFYRHHAFTKCIGVLLRILYFISAGVSVFYPLMNEEHIAARVALFGGYRIGKEFVAVAIVVIIVLEMLLYLLRKFSRYYILKTHKINLI